MLSFSCRRPYLVNSITIQTPETMYAEAESINAAASTVMGNYLPDGDQNCPLSFRVGHENTDNPLFDGELLGRSKPHRE